MLKELARLKSERENFATVSKAVRSVQTKNNHWATEQPIHKDRICSRWPNLFVPKTEAESPTAHRPEITSYPASASQVGMASFNFTKARNSKKTQLCNATTGHPQSTDTPTTLSQLMMDHTLPQQRKQWLPYYENHSQHSTVSGGRGGAEQDKAERKTTNHKMKINLRLGMPRIMLGAYPCMVGSCWNKNNMLLLYIGTLYPWKCENRLCLFVPFTVCVRVHARSHVHMCLCACMCVCSCL